MGRQEGDKPEQLLSSIIISPSFPSAFREHLDLCLPSSRRWPCLPLCPNPSQQPRSASGCLQLDVIRHLPKAVSRRRLSSISFLTNPKSEGSRSTLSVFFHCPLPDVRRLSLGTKLPEKILRRKESRVRRDLGLLPLPPTDLRTAPHRGSSGTGSRDRATSPPACTTLGPHRLCLLTAAETSNLHSSVVRIWDGTRLWPRTPTPPTPALRIRITDEPDANPAPHPNHVSQLHRELAQAQCQPRWPQIQQSLYRHGAVIRFSFGSFQDGRQRPGRAPA